MPASDGVWAGVVRSGRKFRADAAVNGWCAQNDGSGSRRDATRRRELSSRRQRRDAAARSGAIRHTRYSRTPTPQPLQPWRRRASPTAPASIAFGDTVTLGAELAAALAVVYALDDEALAVKVVALARSQWARAQLSRARPRSRQLLAPARAAHARATSTRPRRLRRAARARARRRALRRRVPARALPRVRRRVMRQLLSAVDHIHSLGVITAT